MTALEILISGKVQGVFFRQSTKEKADALGIKGWVKNLDDGRVQIQAEAEEDTMNSFLKWCHNGPERAHVENVETKEVPVIDFSPGFEVKQ